MANHSKVDPEGLLEYSVVYTDRALNHMSKKFQGVMKDLSAGFKKVYNADALVIVPGTGTYGMEAVARQLARGRKVMTLRNGFFNFRWTQIFEMGGIPTQDITLKAEAKSKEPEAPFHPHDIEDVVKQIKEAKPEIVFSTHVETAAGIILPDDYIKKVADACHEVGALFVVDCIASGAMWLDMKKLDIDIITTAPQKGWTSTPCAGLVLLNERAIKAVKESKSDSFSLDLKKWLEIMEAYENGGHAYHCTMPTDSLAQLRDVLKEADKIGFDVLKQKQIELGKKTRDLLKGYGFPSLAEEGYEAPGVVVCYTKDKDIHTGKAFVDIGIQVASGVPLKCDEPAGFQTFRLGLFGIDKLLNVDRTVQEFEDGLKKVVK